MCEWTGSQTREVIGMVSSGLVEMAVGSFQFPVEGEEEEEEEA